MKKKEKGVNFILSSNKQNKALLIYNLKLFGDLSKIFHSQNDEKNPIIFIINSKFGDLYHNLGIIKMHIQLIMKLIFYLILIKLFVDILKVILLYKEKESLFIFVIFVKKQRIIILRFLIIKVKNMK